MSNIDTKLPFEKRIAFLRKCNELYEHSGKSPITDAEYDREYAALRDINPDHEFFSEVGGDIEHIYGTLVPHDIVMGSLNKSANIDEFSQWLRATYPSVEGLRFIFQLKIDGLSLSCLYVGGKLQRVLTRGDGFRGVDVTANAQHVQGIPQSISCTEEVEVRGECFKDRDDFYRNWVGEYENPRNFASGSLNQKDPNVTKERGLQFIAYEVVRKQFKTELEKLLWLTRIGISTFPVANAPTYEGDHDFIVAGVKRYMEHVDRRLLPYAVDGIVVKLDDIALAQEMGTTNEGKRPKANHAVKFPCEQKETKLLDVEWDVGRTGLLAPVGILEPVRLAETTVKRVSLHNPKYIAEMKLSIGCNVLLQKSGDIIPNVVRKTKDGRTPIQIPVQCPSCGEPIDWVDEKHVNKKCTNDMCIAQVNSRIEHWFKTLGVKGIGSGLISRLTAYQIKRPDGEVVPMVGGISDMYALSLYASDLSRDFGDKAFANLNAAIHSVKSVDLALFIEALGIGKIGRMSKDIVSLAPTLKDIDALHVEQIVTIPGFASTKAKSFLNGWNALRKEIDILLNGCVKLSEKSFDSQKLAGKSFCFTGTFSSPRRGEMEKMVEDNGGRLASVSKNLTALVWDGEIQGSKIEKAKKLGIPVIGQKDFLEMLG